MEKSLEAAWVGPKVLWGRVSGNLQGGETVGQANEDSDKVPTYRLGAGRAQQETMASDSTFIREKASAPALAL